MSAPFHRRHPDLARVFLAVLAALASVTSRLPAQPAPGPANPPPLPAPAPSPVDYFRQLLAATPAERERLLAGKSASQLRVLTNSLRIYLALPEAEREVRLRTLELRSHLAPLLRMAPADRAARLQVVPVEFRPVIEQRLTYWDQLPGPLQQQVLDQEKTTRLSPTRLLIHTPPLPPAPVPTPTLPPGTSSAATAVLIPWQAVSPARQQEVIRAFTNLFDLPPELKSKALDPLPLSPTERALIEKALATFRQLQPAQRQACVSAFKQFAEMPPTERVQFLRNAEAWSRMSADDRQRWRDLVHRMPPLPPLPPGFGGSQPVMPPRPPVPRPSAAGYASNSPPLP